MRVYLSEKQTVDGKEYHPGFYPSGRVPEGLAKGWVDAGIACPATDDNRTQWPNGKGQDPKPECLESIKAREDASAAAVLFNLAEAAKLAAVESTGLILDDEAEDEEGYDNG